eukprot:scaffold45330_cov45-Prasinocladus_malaysianus.AAC.1
MRESLKYLNKGRGVDKDLKVASLESRIALTEKFAGARQMIQTNPTAAVSICNELLSEAPSDMQDSEASIRIGDVFAMLIEHWHGQRNMEQAYQLIEKMRARNIILSPYLDSQMVAEVYKAMGINSNPAAAENEDGIEDEDIPFDDEDVNDD